MKQALFAALAVLALFALASSSASAYVFSSPLGFTLETPDTWEEVDDSDPYVSFFFQYYTEEDIAVIMVGVPLRLKATETLGNVLSDSPSKKADYYRTFENMMGEFDFTLLSEEKRVINGMDAFEFTYEIDDSEISMIGRQTVIEADRHILHFTLTSMVDTFDAHSAEFESVLSSLDVGDMQSSKWYSEPVYGSGNSGLIPSLVSDPMRSIGWIIGFAAIPVLIIIGIIQLRKK